MNISIDKLVPYEKNPRFNTHAVDKVAQSIKEFGFNSPIIAGPYNEDKKGHVIIAGHTRLLAAKQLGLKEVPVKVIEHLTEAQMIAHRISDNKTGEYSQWDNELLLGEIEELENLAFDIELTGFDLEDIEELKKGSAFQPATEEEQGKLDNLEPKWINCPHCGEEFDARKK